MAQTARPKSVQWVIPLLLLAGFGMILLGFLLSSRKPTFEIIPTRTGQPERCLTCHNGMEAVSASHPTEEFGCVSCHGGDGLATEQEAAHTGIVRNPGALEIASQYCSECHAQQVVVTQRSLMATYAGAIGLVRRSFGLQPDGTAQFATREIGHLQPFVPAESDPQPVTAFARNCLNCHLYAESIDNDYFRRSTGCSSCHVLYAADGRYRGSDPTIDRDEAGHALRHEFTTAIPYSQCNHCHNRGNYDLRTMTFLQRDDLPLPTGLSAEQRRLYDYYQPIGQFTLCEWELDCIDCHTSQEIMGDGQLYNNRSEAQYIQCAACHGTLDAPPAQVVIDNAGDIAIMRARLNPFVNLPVGATVIMTARGERYWHTRLQDGVWYLTGKATGKRYEIPLVMGSKCEQKPDQQASRYCHECHTYNREPLTP